ncbi:MAG: preprotein translocase subunit SecA [Fimbriiglobus sp.]
MSTTVARPGMESSIWDKIGDKFNGFVEGSIGFVTRLFGTANDRAVRGVGYVRPKNALTHTIIPGSILDKVNSLEEPMKLLSDAELSGLSTKYRERLKQGETLESLMPEAFAACREAARRTKGMRHYDVQVVGGAILHSGAISEMVTGEGKTLVATLPAYLNALSGRGVHVITVNDYLARRDCEWMLPIYNALGVSAAYIQSDQEPQVKRFAYDCDITYGTASEFGFDYLRDNMKPARFDDERFNPFYRQVQRIPLNFALIDEVDNILIDEARTPLIISGPAFSDPKQYERADDIARKLTDLERKARQQLKTNGEMTFAGTEGDNLPVIMPLKPEDVDPKNPPKKGVYFEIKEKERTCHLTDLGVREAEQLAGVESFYTAGNMEWPHQIDNALKAHHMYHKDKQYMIAADPRENNELGIIIIDESTGRAMFGRQWSDGLHQAVEAKHKREGVKIKQETQTLATVTLQNFFKLYSKLGGMTGTAMTEANEFWKIYKLDVVAIPTNRPLQRINRADQVYKTEKEKWDAVVNEVVEVAKTGRPILIGTTDVAKSEVLSSLLKRRGVKHELLNAKPENVARESEIVAQAGRLGAVTISTNMAGRGTDIILGGNPETMAWARLKVLNDADGRPLYPTRLEIPNDLWQKTIDEIEAKEKMKEQGRQVAEMGGLHIVGTARHESRRIDNQLRGRAGRQGDPGSSQFYLSLEDELMRIFGGERLQRLMNNPWFGMADGEAIGGGMLSGQIEKAQRKVEEYHFEQRKNLLEYDEVMDYQRKRTYGARQAVLDDRNPRAMVLEMIDSQLQEAVKRYGTDTYGAASFASYASEQLSLELTAADFRGSDFEEATKIVHDRAISLAPNYVQEMIEESLNPDEDEKDWKWLELSRAIEHRYGLKMTDRDLKKIGRDMLDTHILEAAEKAIHDVDLTAGKRYLEKTYPAESLADWGRTTFGLQMGIDEALDKDPSELLTLLREKVAEAYRRKDVEFPVQVALTAWLPDRGRSERKPDRDSLLNWSRSRIGASTDSAFEDLVRTEGKAKIEAALREASSKFIPPVTYPQLIAKIDEVLSGSTVSEAADATELVEWGKTALNIELDPKELTGVSKEKATDVVLNTYDLQYRPEMHDVERRLVLETIDGSWKSHLLVMDHLRNTVGLHSYAQEDPKIVYKREGMKIFEEMWVGVRDKVCESIFRIEDIPDEEVQNAIYAGARASQQQAVSAAQARASQAAMVEATQQSTNSGEPKKVETIRRTDKKVSRNDPCPCGSGKKYKNCHMKTDGM